MSSISGTEKTEVIYGSSNVINREIQFLLDARQKVDVCLEFTHPTPFDIESIQKSILDARNRGVKLRYLFEITSDNISYSKELTKIAEVRHLGGIKVNFMVSEREYLAPAFLNNPTGKVSQIIYSNLLEIVEQQNYIFDTLWNKAIPATKRIREIVDKETFGVTEVLYGSENAVGRGVQFMKNVKKRMDICFDNKAPSIVVEIDAYRNGYRDIRSRGGKIRAFTEITKDNIYFCKELIKLVDELRHLEGMKGGIAVSETEYMATTVLQEATPLTQVIYSNTREVVEQMQYIFDIFWYRAIPAQKKIRELEEGVGPIETRLLENHDEIASHVRHVLENSSKRLVCVTSGGLQMVHDNFFDLYKKILEKQAKGDGDGICCITCIDQDNKDLVKKFLSMGMKIRHLRNLPPMSFAVDDRYFHATIEKMEGGKMVQSLLTSNESIYINHFSSIFKELWKTGVDAVQRIRDIEEGTDLADIEVFQDTSRTREVYLNLVKEAKKQILLLFPTPKAFSRQSKIGAIELAEKAARERNVRVRILMPTVYRVIDNTKPKTILDQSRNIDVRYIEQMSETKATILVIDKKKSLVMELRDDSKSTFEEAIGLSTYSNSKAGVMSYVAIFDNLWAQSELYEKVKLTNDQLASAIEQLKVHDKIQKDFINIAAHELRTPIQPILGLSDLMLHSVTDTTQLERLDVIVRNAKRLLLLTENILDVTKIESNSLVLKKEYFDLNEVLQHSVADSRNQILRENKFGDIVLELLDPQKAIFIEADKSRVNQVISNLLSNAIKFTSKGVIHVTAVIHDTNEVIVNVMDTGSGIDPGILSHLFSKFVSKSNRGTGLGLFISKNIIEAHGGKIWAKSNENGNGATFSFSIPKAG